MKKIPIKNIVNWHPELKNQEGFLERKAITTDLKTEQDGTAVFLASTPSVDRDGDIVDPLGIDTVNYNGTVLWNHALDTLPVGICVEHNASPEGMLAKIKFSDTYDFAKNIAGLCRENILRGISIGYIPVKVLKAGTAAFDSYVKAKGWITEGCKRIIAECQLIELSICPVGANQDALLLAAKSFDPETCKALKIEIEIQEEPKEEGQTEQATEQEVEKPVEQTTETVGTSEVNKPVEETKAEIVVDECEGMMNPENMEIKPYTSYPEPGKPLYHWGSLTSRDQEQLRRQVYGIWLQQGKPGGSFGTFWETGKPAEKRIKFTDLGTKKSQMNDLTQKAFKVLKGLPV